MRPYNRALIKVPFDTRVKKFNLLPLRYSEIINNPLLLFATKDDFASLKQNVKNHRFLGHI